GELQEKAFEWAASLGRGPVGAMGLTKRAFNHTVLYNLEEALDYEAHIQEVAGKGAEHHEGVTAFLEKRPAKYT
ncbi:MAG: 2-(1,2-epoxy-1,2-dihydrophenyl)acetyl-CoA isomerase, partial [Chloroflexota bacterium]